MSLFDAEFYDFNVHSIPCDPNSIARLAFEAKRHGYRGIAVIDPTINIDAVNKPEDFFIYSGVDVLCKPSKLRDEIKKNRGERILIATGSDEEFNRAAVETEGIDILLRPPKFNNVLAKAACDNSVALGFNIGSIIRTRGEARVRELTIMRSNLKHARKYGLQMILTSDSYSNFDLRSPREMAALASLFGMTAKEAVEAMSATPAWILKRKRAGYIQEGIEIL